MHTMSPSSLATFRQCPRKYKYKYVLGRSTISVSPILQFGSLWDDVTGVWWKDGIEAAVEWLVACAADIDPVVAAKIAALLKHYHPPRDEFEFVGNQVEALVQIRNPETGYPIRGVLLRCFADTLLRHHETGAKVVREAKTTGRVIEGFGDYWQVLQVDGQVNAYYIAFEAETLFYDVAGRPSIKCCGKDEKAARDRLKARGEVLKWGNHEVTVKGPTPQQVVDCYQDRLEALIDETPEKFFQWRPIHKTEDDLLDAQFDLYQQAQMLTAAWKTGRWPRNSSACMMWGRPCSFLDCCCNRADVMDDTLFETKEWAKNRQLPV